MGSSNIRCITNEGNRVSVRDDGKMWKNYLKETQVENKLNDITLLKDILYYCRITKSDIKMIKRIRIGKFGGLYDIPIEVWKLSR